MPKPLLRWTPDFYSRLAKNYDLFARIFFSMGEKGKSKVVKNLRKGKLLDVACGSGNLLMMAHDADASPIGSDTSWGMLAEAKRKFPAAALVQASFFELPFQTGVFDFVVETNAVSGVEVGAEDVLSEMVRVCKVGGEVRIGDYASAPKQTFWRRVVAWGGALFGDYPHDYVAYFRKRGDKTTVEYLGFDHMYQYVRAEKGS